MEDTLIYIVLGALGYIGVMTIKHNRCAARIEAKLESMKENFDRHMDDFEDFVRKKK